MSISRSVFLKRGAVPTPERWALTLDEAFDVENFSAAGLDTFHTSAELATAAQP